MCQDGDSHGINVSVQTKLDATRFVEVDMLKYVIIFVMFLVTLIFSLLPLCFLLPRLETAYIDRYTRYTRGTNILQCFAGGVFMGTILLDLLPGVEQAMSKAFEGLDYPLAQFVVGIGFCLILSVEQTILSCKERTHRPVSSNEQQSPPSAVENSVPEIQSQLVENTDPLVVSNSNPEAEILSANFRPVLLMAALSLHSVFEGIALGLMMSTKSILELFFAIIIHKTIIAFSLGLAFVRSKVEKKTIINLSMWFSGTAPLGILLAMTLLDISHGKNTDLNLPSGILQGLATGTFFYITFFEILPNEINNGQDRLLKVLATWVGFSLICSLLLLNSGYDKPFVLPIMSS